MKQLICNTEDNIWILWMSYAKYLSIIELDAFFIGLYNLPIVNCFLSLLGYGEQTYAWLVIMEKYTRVEKL